MWRLCHLCQNSEQHRPWLRQSLMEKPGICLVLCLIAGVTFAVDWPIGTYTLVKPRSGCPPDWMEGWTDQDNEDSHNSNSMSYGHHFAGSFGGNMKFYYCTKNPNIGVNGGLWPGGNYCILQHGESCPVGFQPGSVYWDDEDSRNNNSHGGVLPTGFYGRNTKINYCCRDDGQYNTSIALPNSRPFYLLRFTSPCQMIKGMYVREESVDFDDEDHNNENYASGKHPLGTGGGRNQRLMYCYYSHLRAK